MNKIKISVIVPTYNRKDLLTYTLKSFHHQTMDKNDYEIIICDDGSTDHTFDLVKSYIDKMNIKYYFHNHDGFRAALTRNMGINIAKGEVCAFLDSGMIACENFLEEHYGIHNMNQVNCIVTGRILGFKLNKEAEEELKQLFDMNHLGQSFSKISSNEKFCDERDNILNHIGSHMDAWPAPWIYFWSGNISVKKEELEKIGLFDENYVGWGGEDTDLGIRLYLNNLKYIYTQKAQAIHYPHPQTSISKEEFNSRVIQRKTYLCEKYGSRVKGMEYWLQVGSTKLNPFLFDMQIKKDVCQ